VLPKYCHAEITATSLKLPEDLKLKAIAAAQDVGVTPHAFMVEAIRQAVAASEKRAQFVDESTAARTQMLQTGMGYDAKEVHAYLPERLVNSEAPAPEMKPWRS
jgi:predicted transcriptional regulator